MTVLKLSHTPWQNVLKNRTLLGALLCVVFTGICIVILPPLAYLAAALCIVVFSVFYVERLAILMFWTLPYMAVNLPTGVFTLKLCDAPAYLFATAFLAGALLRRQPILWPPATLQVIVYAAVLAVCAIFSPPVPIPYVGSLADYDRNSPQWRSLSFVILTCLSWLIVVGLYNVISRRPDLYRRCICAHVLSGGLASLISLIMYALGLTGMAFATTTKDLLVNVGGILRLAGVAYEPLFLAFYLITTVPVTVALLFFRPGWLPQRLLIAILMAEGLALLLTFSTGGWISLPIALLLMWPLWRSHPLPRHVLRTLGLGFVVIFVSLTVLVSSVPNLNRLVTMTIAKVTSGGDSVRNDEAAAAINIMTANPIFGIGPGMAGFHFPRYHPAFASQFVEGIREITPLYLDVLAETGVVGFLALGWCAVAGLAELMKPIKRFGAARLPLLTAFIGSLIGCAVQYCSLDAIYLVYFPALIGLACAGTRVAHLRIESAPILELEAS